MAEEIYETWHATDQTWHVIHALPPLTSQTFTNSTPYTAYCNLTLYTLLIRKQTAA